MSQRGLGKGLSALFMDQMEQEDPNKSESLLMVNLSQIEPNTSQPRKQFNQDSLSDLTESIRTHGILQPLAVRKTVEGRYQIIAGERRWRAAREAGLSEVSVYLVNADDRTVLELALVENLQRQDLNPIEEAEGYRTLIDEFALTQEETAQRIGKSRPAVANALRLLALAPKVRTMVADGLLSAGHAKVLLSLTDPDVQTNTATILLENNYNVRQTEQLVKKILQEEKKEAKTIENNEISVNYLEDIERRLATKLGRKVKLINGRKKGRIELEFYNSDDLEKLIDFLEAGNFDN